MPRLIASMTSSPLTSPISPSSQSFFAVPTRPGVHQHVVLAWQRLNQFREVAARSNSGFCGSVCSRTDIHCATACERRYPASLFEKCSYGSTRENSFGADEDNLSKA